MWRTSNGLSMAHLGTRIARLVRAAAYKIYRKTKPSGWVHTLSDEELEREVACWYFAASGDRMDFAHPQSFSQKMQWLKVHDKDPRKATLSDKLAVREYIAARIGDEVLPKVYRVWDKADDISFDGLPSRFFLKCNNGSGMMRRITDAPSTSADELDELRKTVAGWYARDFAAEYFEMHYADITPRVYAEEWLDDIEWEYQAWCFSGKVAFIAAIHEPHGVNEKQFFLPTWEKLPFVSSQPEYQGTIEQPDCLMDLLTWSERLADDFCFVRVDWYGTRHGLMFSEMSFTPAYGIVHWDPARYNDEVGTLLQLPIDAPVAPTAPNEG